MNLREKLSNLARQDNLALYKWTAGKSRIASDLILLSDVRLNILTSVSGVVHFSCSAPVVLMENGRSVVHMYDDGVVTVIDGPRKGINIPASFLKDGERAIPTPRCCHLDVTEDCSASVRNKVMSLGCSPVYPSSILITPELYRITKKPETLKPILTAAMLKCIGAVHEDTHDTIMQKFLANIDCFCARTADGYLVPGDIVAAGGCCVICSRGISARSGSLVHMMPYTSLYDTIEGRHWNVHLSEENAK